MNEAIAIRPTYQNLQCNQPLQNTQPEVAGHPTRSCRPTIQKSHINQSGVAEQLTRSCRTTKQKQKQTVFFFGRIGCPQGAHHPSRRPVLGTRMSCTHFLDIIGCGPLPAAVATATATATGRSRRVQKKNGPLILTACKPQPQPQPQPPAPAHSPSPQPHSVGAGKWMLFSVDSTPFSACCVPRSSRVLGPSFHLPVPSLTSPASFCVDSCCV